MSDYESRKVTSMYWFNKSSDLHAGAAALWMSMEDDIASKIVNDCELGDGFKMDVAVGPVFYMLCGMAMELIFKAITVEAGGQINEKHHQLLQHLALTELTYSSTERKLLQMLSHDIIWAGRYPTAKSEDQMVECRELAFKNLFERVPGATFLRPNDALDWKAFHGLWSKATQEYFRIKAL